jgi:hypothetical protein
MKVIDRQKRHYGQYIAIEIVLGIEYVTAVAVTYSIPQYNLYRNELVHADRMKAVYCRF